VRLKVRNRQDIHPNFSINHQPSPINHRPSPINHQPSPINYRIRGSPFRPLLLIPPRLTTVAGLVACPVVLLVGVREVVLLVLIICNTPQISMRHDMTDPSTYRLAGGAWQLRQSLYPHCRTLRCLGHRVGSRSPHEQDRTC
jgi:hypothetical protein